MPWISSLIFFSGRKPKYQQIAEGIAQAIQVGQLSPGQRLPGSRAFAQQIGVHRNTVLLAFEDLIAQGWLTTVAQKGTYVSTSLPEQVRRRAVRERSERSAFTMPARRSIRRVVEFAPKNTLDLSGGLPDLRLTPNVELARAFRRAVTRSAGLAYGDCQGHYELRHQLARLLSESRGLATQPEQVFVTPGSQGALYLIATALVSPGDTVVIEQLGYRPAWNCFRLAGASLHAIPVDSHGLNIDTLESYLQSNRIRAVYLTPHHHYPTTAVLSASRRMKLLALAKSYRFAIIEDDYDNEVHYAGKPVLPLASADRHGSVIYVGTLSKVLAPGLRIGYLVAPANFLERVAEIRECIDRQGCPAIEMAVAELLEDGVLQRHARKMRRVYQSRRDVLVSELAQELGAHIEFELPKGGLALWIRSANSEVEGWATSARKQGLHFHTAKHYAWGARSPEAFRLCYAKSTEEELRSAVKILSASRPS
ncbi:MAG: PLP-dependent aminotransferase family protein [Kofleriaceae bacterium]|nr:PLP-dependent aminotransferase family protein [Kofleriaceae bacterium]